jgi:hypothetical protein
MSYSYATLRKIRIIEERLGPEWALAHPNESIDSVYNTLMGDDRKNLFCKISKSSKDQLDEMTTFYKTGMADFIEALIRAEWDRHNQRTDELARRLIGDFNGT